MILLLRYAGLRIRDGVTLKRDRIVPADSTSEFLRVFLYTQKTGPVSTFRFRSWVVALQKKLEVEVAASWKATN